MSKTKPKHEVRKRFPQAFRTALRLIPPKHGMRGAQVHQIAYRTGLPGEHQSRLVELGRGETSSLAWKDALSKIEAEEFAKALTA